jgi:hypothetical protein
MEYTYKLSRVRLIILGIGLLGSIAATYVALMHRKMAIVDAYHVRKSQIKSSVQNIALKLSERSNELLHTSLSSYDDIKEIVSVLGKDRLKDIIIFDRQGVTTFHEDKDFVVDKVQAIEIQEQYGATVVAESFEKAQQGNAGSLEFTNNAGDKWLLIYEPVSKLGWSIALFTPESAILLPTEQVHIYETRSIICLLAAILFFLAILLTLYDPKGYARFVFTVLYILIVAGGIGLIIKNNYYFTHYIHNQQAVTSELAVSQLKTDLEVRSGKEYVSIPTYFLMQFFEVKDPTLITFSAFVEQRIDRARYPDVQLGFGLTNASRVTTVKKVREYRRGTEEIVQFEVEGAIYQASAIYSQMFPKMPFDMQSMSLRMEPVQQKLPVILVPDFEKYEHINPDDKPGLDETFALKDYEFITSYFLYKFESDEPMRPLLTYAVFVQRNLLSITLEYFLPLFVILLTIFIMSMMSVHIKPTKQVNIIGVVSVLFFSLILVHQNFRASFTVEGLPFLEAIILMVYGSLCYGYFDAVYLINKAYLHSAKMLLYWPVIVTYLLIATAIYL